MTTDAQPEVSQEAKPPKCPGCQTQPLRFCDRIQPTTSGTIVSLIWCADCGYLFEARFVGKAGPANGLVAPAGPVPIRPRQ